MVKASHYVIENMSMVLETKNINETNRIFYKFSAHYSDGKELAGICGIYNRYIKSRDSDILEEVKLSLDRLGNT